MKKNYIFTLLLTLCLSTITFGQTTLVAGDIVIIEMQGDAPDGFRFVPLVDLQAGTVIRFTDNGWNGTALRTGEGTVVYTVPSGGLTKGTNIRYTVGDTTDFTTEGGDINISTSGDQILAYQGDSTTPTFIFAAAGNSTAWQTGSDDSNQTDLPQGLTDGTNAVAAGSGSGAESEFDNIYYSGITTGTKADLLLAVATASNWAGSNTLPYSAITSNFTITSTASVKDNAIAGFKTYPNPITDKRFTIASNNSDTKQVTIFNVLGKKVFSTSFSGANKNIDVSAINAGIYILKVVEAGKTATKKLVIR